MQSWAVDLKDVGAVYPWQGGEVVMVLVLLVLWILWHVWQFRFENRSYEEEAAKFADKEKIKQVLDIHPGQ
jgi:Tfp pilus assembly protein PilO